MIDKESKGRGKQLSGAEVWNSRLTAKDVREIKMMILAGERVGNIAKTFKVKPNTISSIKNGRNWRHVHCNQDCNQTRESKAAFKKEIL